MSLAESDRLSNRGHVVHLVHGILTHADWAEMMAQTLEKIPNVEVRVTSYGKFELFRFLLPGPTRRGPIEKTAGDLVDSFAYAQRIGKPLSVIAHSNGTYAVYQALRKHPSIKLDYLVLCGAVIGQNHDIRTIKEASVRKSLINDFGTRDVWPTVASAVTWGYGNGGTYGIGAPAKDRRHPYRHSDFFSEDFVEKFWAPLFISDDVVRKRYEPYPEHPLYFKVFDLPWRWLLAILLLMPAIFWAYVIFDGSNAGEKNPNESQEVDSQTTMASSDPLNAFLEDATLSTPIEQFDLRLSMGRVLALGIENENVDAKAFTPLSNRNLVVAYADSLPLAVGYIGDGTNTRIPGLSVGRENGKTLDSTDDMLFEETYGSCNTLRIPNTSAYRRIYLSECYFGGPGSHQSYGFIYKIPEHDFGDGCYLDYSRLHNEGIAIRDIAHIIPKCSFFKGKAIGFATLVESVPRTALLDNMLLTLSTASQFIHDQ